MGNRISQHVLKELMYQLITLLVEEKLANVQNGEAYVRVINLHCVKIIERSDHTNIIWYVFFNFFDLYVMNSIIKYLFYEF